MSTTTILDQYKEYLKKATQDVFETMVYMTAEPAGEAGEDQAGQISCEVIASLGFTGTVNGIIITSCSMELARKITANMLGIDVSEIGSNSEVGDAMGEITNMIAGNVKNKWVEDGGRMELSVPMVAMGEPLQAAISSNHTHGFAVHFNMEDGGVLKVEIRFEGEK